MFSFGLLMIIKWIQRHPFPPCCAEKPFKISQCTKIKHVKRSPISFVQSQSTIKRHSYQFIGKNRYQSNYNIRHTKANRHLRLPNSQDQEVILPKKTKRKSQKVLICKTRMPIYFNKLCAHMFMTTKCYIGQMLEVCLETTKAKTLSIRSGSRFPTP